MAAAAAFGGQFQIDSVVTRAFYGVCPGSATRRLGASPGIRYAAAMLFRLATAADVPALHPLIERAYRGEASRAGWTHEADLLTTPRTDVATLAAIIADPRETFIIAVDGTAIAGCVQVTAKSDGLAYLGFLAVEPRGQTNGLGRRLIAAAEDHARNLGATRMEMTVVDRRVELVAYYERRGYALTGETRPFPAALLEGTPLAFVVLTKQL